jgi:hypothetical protein
MTAKSTDAPLIASGLTAIGQAARAATPGRLVHHAAGGAALGQGGCGGSRGPGPSGRGRGARAVMTRPSKAFTNRSLAAGGAVRCAR